MLLCFLRIVFKDSACFFPTKKTASCIPLQEEYKSRPKLALQNIFMYMVFNHLLRYIYSYFLCFTRHLLFPSDCILNEICLNSVCIVKKKKNDLKGYSPVHSLKPFCFHLLFLWVAQSSSYKGLWEHQAS